MRAVLFSNRHWLGDEKIRQSIFRIPEVSMRVRFFQKLLDKYQIQGLDVAHLFLNSEESSFQGSHCELLISLVQLGLFDRYIKQFGRPDYVSGLNSVYSPIQMIDYKKLISSVKNIHEAPQTISSNPVPYGIYKLEDDATSYKPIDFEDYHLGPVVRWFMEKGIYKFITIGPGCCDYNHLLRGDFAFGNIQVLDSIEMDPLLHWFWMSPEKVKSVP